jgi:hypothetical protein
MFVCSRADAAELHWDVPETCPDARALERESEQALGEPLANYPLRIAGTVRATGTQLKLSLRISMPTSDETRERELEAATCQELLEAAAVAIALAAADSSERQPQPPRAVAQSVDRDPPPLAAEPEPAPSSTVAIEAAAAGSVGAFPKPGFGAALQIAWVWRAVRVGVSGTWYPPRSMQLDEGLSASFGMYFAELLLCGQGRLARTLLIACGSGSLGRIGAYLDGPEPVRTESTAWRALGIRVGVSYPIAPPLEVTASLSMWIPLTRPIFYAFSVPTEPGPPVPAPLLHDIGPVQGQLLLGALFSL